MKKILAMMLLAAMMLTMLAACDKNEGTPYVPPTVNAGGNTTAPSGDPDTDPDDGPVVEPDDEDTVQIWKEFSADTTTPETVLTAENDCVITIGEMGYEDEDVVFEITLENPTDEEIEFQLSGIAFNKAIYSYYEWELVEPGETGTMELWFSFAQLQIMGVFQVAVVDIAFEIFDSEYNKIETLNVVIEAENADAFLQDEDTFYHVINDKNAQKEAEFSLLDAQQVNVDLGNGVKLITQAVLSSQYTDAVAFEFLNESNKTQNIDWYVRTINGLAISANPDWGDILPGCRWIMIWSVEDDLSATKQEVFGIESLATIGYEIATANSDGQDSVYTEGEYAIPGEEPTLDMTATVIYNDNGLKISAKEPVTEKGSDYTYVYLIFEAEDSMWIEANNAEITVEGDAENPWCNAPYSVYKGETDVSYAYASDAEGSTITVPLHITSSATAEEQIDVVIELELEF